MYSNRNKKMDEMERYLQRLIFQHNVREQIIFLLLFFLLYIVAFIIILKYQERYNEYSIIDEDEVNIYYSIMWVCLVTLAIVWLSGNLLPVRVRRLLLKTYNLHVNSILQFFGRSQILEESSKCTKTHKISIRNNLFITYNNVTIANEEIVEVLGVAME